MQMSEDELRYAIAVDFTAYLLSAHHAAHRMTPISDIVIIGSLSAHILGPSSTVYAGVKAGIAGFSEALRRELGPKGIKVSLVEPGAVSTELASHNREEIQEGMRARFGSIERLESQDIAEAISFIVTRPRHVAVNEVLVRPTEQEG